MLGRPFRQWVKISRGLCVTLAVTGNLAESGMERLYPDADASPSDPTQPAIHRQIVAYHRLVSGLK